MARRRTRVDLLGPLLAAASSKDAIRNRIRLVAYECGLSQAEIRQAIKANTRTRNGTDALLAFADKYAISLKWLIMGELRSHPKVR
jgi:hypothetical protein